MFTISKRSISGVVLLLALSACASQAPRFGHSAMGYSVSSFEISADGNERALSVALDAALSGGSPAAAMSAKANITIDLVRYNAPIIGLFYGGQHHASLSVKLSDNTGSRISSFPIYVASNGSRDTADAAMAEKAAEIIAANAANAFMPAYRAAKPNLVVAPAVAPVVIAPEVEVPDVVADETPALDTGAPCVIGPEGKCLVL